jgi:hypothetical protein
MMKIYSIETKVWIRLNPIYGRIIFDEITLLRIYFFGVNFYDCNSRC